MYTCAEDPDSSSDSDSDDSDSDDSDSDSTSGSSSSSSTAAPSSPASASSSSGGPEDSPDGDNTRGPSVPGTSFTVTVPFEEEDDVLILEPSPQEVREFGGDPGPSAAHHDAAYAREVPDTGLVSQGRPPMPSAKP